MRRIPGAKPGMTAAVQALPVSTASSSWLVDARLVTLRKVFIVNVDTRRTVRNLSHALKTSLAKIIRTLKKKTDFRHQPRALQ